MYYYGYFRDTDLSTDRLGNLYKVVIITNFRNKEYADGGELLLSDSPFTVSWSGEEDNLFKGYKCSTATVGFYQENYNFEFNNTSENNVYVALLKLKVDRKKDEDLGILTDGDVYDIVWTGFATPNAYSQEYSSSLDYFELECQDALSTLKYNEYKPVRNESLKPFYTTFSDIVIKYAARLGSYRNIYISNSLVLPTEDLGSILEFLYIDEKDFYDEDGKSMTVLEVLNEICIYLGLTMTTWGDSIFFLDYYGLESGLYHRIYTDKDGDYSLFPSTNILDWSIGSSMTEFTSYRDIMKEDFMDSGTTLSLGNTYNKVKVLSDLYSYDSILYNPDEDIYDYAKVFDTVDTTYGKSKIVRSDSKKTEIHTSYTEDSKNHYVKTFYRFKNINDSLAQNPTNFFYMFYTRWFNLDSSKQQDGALLSTVNSNYDWTYKNLREKVGACFVDYCSTEVDSLDDIVSEDMNTAIIMSLHNSKVYTEDYGDGYWYYYGYRNLYTNNSFLGSEDCVNQMLYTVNTDQIAVGSDNYIVIKGDITYFNDNDFYIPHSTDSESTQYVINFIWCTITDNRGNYWDGEKWKKASEFTMTSLDGSTATLKPKFKLPLKHAKGKTAFNTSFSFGSSVNTDYDVEASGYVIPVPVSDDTITPIRFSFSMYRPWGVNAEKPSDLALLKDFDITIGTKTLDDVVKDSDNTNTEYTNTLNISAVEEYPEISMKICSWDNKQANYSNTFWYHKSPKNITGGSLTGIIGGYDYKRVNYIHNKYTGQGGKPEELALHNYCRQYNSGVAKLELSLLNSLGLSPYSTLTYHFLQGKTFVVDGMSIDYAYDTVRLTLIERK